VTFGGGEEGRGTLLGDGREEGSSFTCSSFAGASFSAAGVDVVAGASLPPAGVAAAAAAAAAFLSFTAEAASKAACRRARGTAAMASLEASVVAVTGAWEEGALVGVDVDGGVGVADEEDGAGALAGVVVIDVAVEDTGPIASFSSPNSFHSSTWSRSWLEMWVS
jgi:hypothetical protein